MNQEQIHQLISHHPSPHPNPPPQLLETHISWVVLTDTYAYKIKKPVTLPFVDFSSLASRNYYCRREVLLNSRFSSDVYLGKVPVREVEGIPVIGSKEGEIIDWAVKMRRLESRCKMDTLLQQDQVHPQQMILLAQEVATFHQEALQVSPPIPQLVSRQAADFNGILDIQAQVETYFPLRYHRLIQQAVRISQVFLKRYSSYFSHRVQKGFYRDVHGDLHSGNIFLCPSPILFDCLEFNDEWRQIDVLNEIAFLCMDLEFYGKPGLSQVFLQQYLDMFPCMQDPTDKELFIYYKLYRANVRAKVHLIRASELTAHVEAQQEELANARKYLELMDRYQGHLTAPSPATV